MSSTRKLPPPSLLEPLPSSLAPLLSVCGPPAPPKVPKPGRSSRPAPPLPRSATACRTSRRGAARPPGTLAGRSLPAAGTQTAAAMLAMAIGCAFVCYNLGCSPEGGGALVPVVQGR